MQDIMEDIKMAKERYGSIQQVFLCDGDAIAVDAKDLLKIIQKLKETFPDLREISSYVGPISTLSKSVEELKILREAGLTKAYLGVESGDDTVLKDTVKGVNAKQMLQAGQNLVCAGIELYAIVLLGLAGKERSHIHAVETAKMINEMKPKHLTAMTYMPVRGTKMYKDIEEGKFTVLNTMEYLQEIKALIENITVDNLHFLSNHASNYVSFDGYLQKDKSSMIDVLNKAIKMEIPVRHEQQRGL